VDQEWRTKNERVCRTNCCLKEHHEEQGAMWHRVPSAPHIAVGSILTQRRRDETRCWGAGRPRLKRD
jgi:hypothetical protein